MAPYKRPFHCEILTPQGSRCACEAVSVVFPAMDGQYGVMGGRTPLVTMLGVGVVSVESTEGETTEFFLSGGFATVRENKLIILADECENASEIDREEAWEAITEARAMADDSDEEFELRNQALDIARKRFAIVQKKGREKRQQDGGGVRL